MAMHSERIITIPCGHCFSSQIAPTYRLLYYYFIPHAYFPFHATKGTIRQLENSGGLRLIRNSAAADSIVMYYNEVESAEGQLNAFARYFDQYHEVAFTVFDYSQIDTLFYDRGKILTSSKSFTLLDSDPPGEKFFLINSMPFGLSWTLIIDTWKI
jgi:hypothetical protein